MTRSTWCQRLLLLGFHLDAAEIIMPHGTTESAAPMRLDRKCIRPSDRLVRYRQLGLGTGLGTFSILLALALVLVSGTGTGADWVRAARLAPTYRN